MAESLSFGREKAVVKSETHTEYYLVKGIVLTISLTVAGCVAARSNSQISKSHPDTHDRVMAKKDIPTIRMKGEDLPQVDLLNGTNNITPKQLEHFFRERAQYLRHRSFSQDELLRAWSLELLLLKDELVQSKDEINRERTRRRIREVQSKIHILSFQPGVDNPGF